MPHYDYKCDDCEKTSEVFQRMRDDAETVCPDCGGDNYKRLVSAGQVGIMQDAGTDPTVTARKHYKTRLGEQVFTNPTTQKTEILKGSKKARKRQIENSIIAADPTVKRKDITLMNL